MIVAAKLVDVPIFLFGFGSPNALLGVAWNDPLLPLSESADTGATRSDEHRGSGTNALTKAPF